MRYVLDTMTAFSEGRVLGIGGAGSRWRGKSPPPPHPPLIIIILNWSPRGVWVVVLNCTTDTLQAETGGVMVQGHNKYNINPTSSPV